LAATTADHEGVKGLVRLKGIAKIKANGGNISITDTSVVVKMPILPLFLFQLPPISTNMMI
jgi:hypothetical protein